jgi:hypothetical protein
MVRFCTTTLFFNKGEGRWFESARRRPFFATKVDGSILHGNIFFNKGDGRWFESARRRTFFATKVDGSILHGNIFFNKGEGRWFDSARQHFFSIKEKVDGSNLHVDALFCHKGRQFESA